MTRSQLLAIAIVLAGVALAGTWFHQNYERVPHREWTGFKGEARRNPYLAAERMLARMGLPARTAALPFELRDLPSRATLVLPDRRAGITPDVRQRLLQWVDAGGYLIIEDENYRLPDPFLDAFDVTRKPTKTTPARAGPMTVSLPHAPKALRVTMHSENSFVAPARG